MNLNGNKFEETNVLPFNTYVFHEVYMIRCIDFLHYLEQLCKAANEFCAYSTSGFRCINLYDSQQ